MESPKPNSGPGPLRGLIFDFDGTLAELNIDFAAMAAEVRALGRELGFAGRWPGGYLLEQVEQVAGAMDGRGAEFAQGAAGLIQDRELAAADRGGLFDFTPRLLARARGLGLGLAVVSRNCQKAIQRVFPGIDGAVDVFLPREAVRRTKPHPAHLLDACQGLGLGPGQAAMVGDHPTDMQAAHAAGCLPVGVASGRVDEKGLARAGARITLPDASGLLEALGRLGGLA